jgi:hypothetical protein
MPPVPAIIPVGIAPRFPSWIIVAIIVAAFALVAEIDSMSKYAGRISTKYGFVGGDAVLQKAIVTLIIAVGVVVIFLMS